MKGSEVGLRLDVIVVAAFSVITDLPFPDFLQSENILLDGNMCAINLYMMFLILYMFDLALELGLNDL